MVHTVKIFKALSDGNRMRVVQALMNQEEVCACQIVELLQVTGATTSRHMSILIDAGLVTSRKEGRWVYYRLNTEQEAWMELVDWLQPQLELEELFKADLATMNQIMSQDKSELCRSQNGSACC